MLNIIYNYFFLYSLLYIIISSNKFFFRFNNLFFISSIFFHLTITIIYINIFPVGDWETFMWSQEDGVKQLKLSEISFASFRTSNLVLTIIFFSKKFLYLNNVNIIFLFSIISFFGILIFVNNLIKLGLEKKLAYWLMFLPGIHFWTGTVGKDALLIFFLSYFFSLYIEKKFFFSLVFIFFIWMVRPHIGALFLMSILFTEFFLIKGLKLKFVMLLILSIVFYSILHIPMTKGYFLSTSTGLADNMLLQIMSQTTELAQKYQSSSSSYGSGNIISNMFSYLMFPTEFIFSNKSKLIDLVILGEICTFIYIVFLISNHKKKAEVNKRIIFFLVICVLLYLLTMPQILFNFGLNIRQKWMILPFVIYLTFSLKNLFVSKYNT